jgi:hypothetical protein
MAKVIATMGQSDGDWVERLTGSLAGQNPLDGFLMGIIGWIFGFFLALEVMMVQAGLYFAGLLTVFTIWLRDMGKMGPRLWRWTISLGIAAAFTKPLMIFFLAAGSTLIAHLPDSIQGTSSIPISIFSVILAWASPLILFFAANYKLIKGETRSQIEGEIDTNSRSTDVTPTAIASQGGAMQPIQVTVMSAAPGGPPSRNVGPGLATIMGVQATRAGVMTATRAAGSVGGPIGAVALVAGTATDKYLKNKTEK